MEANIPVPHTIMGMDFLVYLTHLPDFLVIIHQHITVIHVMTIMIVFLLYFLTYAIPGTMFSIGSDHLQPSASTSSG